MLSLLTNRYVAGVGIALMLCAAIAFGLWRFHHAAYAAGEAAGNAKMAALMAQYQGASAKAAAHAKALQAQADAEALAQAKAKVAAGAKAAQDAAKAADSADSRLAALRRKLDEESAHDATLAAWRAARRPADTLGLRVTADQSHSR